MSDKAKAQREQASPRVRAFVARWRHLLAREPKPVGSGPVIEGRPLYHDGWASDGCGCRIDIIGVPDAWCDRLDAFLTDLSAKEPAARIFQLKLKFGGIRLYLENASKEAEARADSLARELRDDALIY